MIRAIPTTPRDGRNRGGHGCVGAAERL